MAAWITALCTSRCFGLFIPDKPFAEPRKPTRPAGIGRIPQQSAAQLAQAIGRSSSDTAPENDARS